MLRYLTNVVTLDLDEKVCNACGMCVIVCPHRVFEIANSKPPSHGDENCLDCGACTGDDCLFQMGIRKAVVIDRDACIECGACALNCPVDAIQVQTGTGCASAILLRALGRQSDCSAALGCAPVGETTIGEAGCTAVAPSCGKAGDVSCSGSEASPAEVNRR